MFDKMTENVKFFLVLLVYTVTMTWWASSLNSTVEYNTQAIGKTLVALDKHIERCNKLTERETQLDYQMKNLKHEIEELKRELKKK